MKLKGLSKEQAEEQVELLRKRIEFNNKLNAFVRKFRKEHDIGFFADNNANIRFNGFHDEPLPEMRDAMRDIFINNSLGDLSWMSLDLKRKYIKDTSAIFGRVYSAATNDYLLKDLHDGENYLKTLASIEEKPAAEVEDDKLPFKIEHDFENTRINLYFDYIPSEEERAILKHRGFKWSPSRKAWTRQLTSEAEKSLELVKSDFKKLN